MDEKQRQRPIRLSELAIACHVFEALTGYGISYRSFLCATNGSPDLRLAAHRKALLKWLNAWGCRQFAREWHDLASKQIRLWYEEYGDALCPRDRDLRDLSSSELTVAARAYASLSSRTVSRYRRKGNANLFEKTAGPAGAAKILFAIRPRALLPWDAGIREGLGHSGSGASYVSYLRGARVLLEELTVQCQRHGLELFSLPQELGKPDSSVAMLLNEYYWVTITRGYRLPDSVTFQRWAKWDQP